jgi:hypothetical protein
VDAVPQCVICGATDNAPKTWVQSTYVPEYPSGFVAHSEPGACLDRLKKHRKDILDGTLAPGSPLAIVQPQTARELTPAEAKKISDSDVVNPPESISPTVLQKVPAEAKKKKITTKKLTAKEQARYDALFCAVVIENPGWTPAQIRMRTDELWEVLA